MNEKTRKNGFKMAYCAYCPKFRFLPKKTMAHVYVVANLGKTAVIFSNMSKVWRYVETAAAGSEIYHGTTAMDAFRLRRVKNYAAFTTSLKLNGFTAAPFFWETSAGVVAITITRQRVE